MDRLETDIDRLQQDDRQRRARGPGAGARSRQTTGPQISCAAASKHRRSGSASIAPNSAASSYGLALADAPPLRALDDGQDSGRFAFAEEDIARVRDPELRATLDTLRKPAPAKPGEERPLRPIAFEPPADTDAETVQLHPEHPLVQRLLGRFVNQGLVHHDLRTAAGVASNWDLSTARAIAVYEQLLRNAPALASLENDGEGENGRGQKLIGVSGYAEYRPIAPNVDEPSRAANRRIDLRFLMATPRQEEVERLQRQMGSER